MLFDRSKIIVNDQMNRFSDLMQTDKFIVKVARVKENLSQLGAILKG